MKKEINCKHFREGKYTDRYHKTEECIMVDSPLKPEQCYFFERRKNETRRV
jgi:hypothetical protein